LTEKAELIDKPEPEWVVWLTVAIALLIGFWLQLSASREMQSVTIGDSTITYPADWTPTKRENLNFSAADLKEGPFGMRIAIAQFDKKKLLPGT
jgi:hypothetical protein